MVAEITLTEIAATIAHSVVAVAFAVLLFSLWFLLCDPGDNDDD